ncbi:hypothetical protein H2198_010555 [Neophaeococcomyces mojaviensis]|uniref:Uncharacterized protein n=1 Tax=Neophaeococcomyces mojaviensis TaxID=3383035 RepID=A0ACC2ZR82_9EURO|nr:hypothetical protein H2198_010555 [Knufia sp. JES_112]
MDSPQEAATTNAQNTAVSTHAANITGISNAQEPGDTVDAGPSNPTESFPSTGHGITEPTTVEPKTSITEGETRFLEAIQRSTTTASGRPYSSFSSHQKVFIVLVATLGGTFSPFTANIYLPAIDTISHDLKVSVTQVNLTITTYMIFQAIAPSFISAIADLRGRRPGYVIGFTVYIAANLGLALNNSYPGLLTIRCLQSCGSSGLVALNQGTIADVVTSAERGKYISITSISSVLGPSIAPIAGGLLAQHLGWHSIFWFLLILSGVYFVPLILFFPETARSIVGDGTIKPPVWNRTLMEIVRKHHNKSLTDPEQVSSSNEAEAVQRKAATAKRHINPLATLSVVTDPETALILAATGIAYAGFYCVNTSLTVQFHAIYNLSTSLQGLLFLPQTVGSILAAITNSKLLDRQYKVHATRAGVPVDKKKQIDIVTSVMPIERARLEVAVPMFVASCIAVMIYGWLLEARVNIAGPIVMLGVIGYTALAGFSALSVLIIDLHRRTPATASAANSLVRCLLGAGASAVINPMIEAMGVGWCFTLVGLLVGIVVLPSLLWCFRYGHLMRAKRAEKARRKEEQKEQKEAEKVQDHQR